MDNIMTPTEVFAAAKTSEQHVSRYVQLISSKTPCPCQTVQPALRVVCRINRRARSAWRHILGFDLGAYGIG